MAANQGRTLRRPSGDTAVPTQTGLLLLPNFSLLGVIAAIDVMRHANRLSRKNLYAWRTYSSDGAAVRASNGLVLNAERIPPADAYRRLIAAEDDDASALALIDEARRRFESAGESTVRTTEQISERA